MPQAGLQTALVSPADSDPSVPLPAAAPAPAPAPLPPGLGVPAPRPSWWRRLGGWAHPRRWIGELSPKRLWQRAREYVELNPPTTLVLYTPLLVLALVLFTRAPWTNYIFDEQEALLANPYINRTGGLGFGDAIYRDFWGLPPNASIGSYRPIPSMLWYLLWGVSKHPFFHHLYNIVLHALNGALLGAFAWSVSKRRSVAWLSAATFTGCALVTEAVSGIVGIADVLGGLGAIAALHALRLPGWGMPLGVFAATSFALFSKESGMVLVPLVPLGALLFAHAHFPERPARVARAALAAIVCAMAFVLYVELRKAWFHAPIPESLTKPLPADASDLQVMFRELLLWFGQAPLPNDPINNPLIDADFPHRLAGALRVYWRGLGQVVFPKTLSGDYSFPQEPIPDTLWGWETIAGGVMMLLPVAVGIGLATVSWLREARVRRQLERAGAVGGETVLVSLAPRHGPLRLAAVRLPRRPWGRRRLELCLLLCVAGAVGLGTELVLLGRGSPSWVRTWPLSVMLLLCGFGLLVEGWSSPPTPWRFRDVRPLGYDGPLWVSFGALWLVVSYFPHSNIPQLLPTVRAERLWYFPVIGTSLVLGHLLARQLAHGPRAGWRWPPARVAGLTVVVAFVGFQFVQTYRHSMDYRDDLVFWGATKDAVPNSAKAHLNYSVMKGARGDLETRLVHSRIAAQLAPQWPMAHIYTGDTLCRLHRPDEAWPHYVHGFKLAPNERSLLALALQCLWDEDRAKTYQSQLEELSAQNEGSWLAWLARDLATNGEKNHGVDPKYRPRGYNEGPKQE